MRDHTLKHRFYPPIEAWMWMKFSSSFTYGFCTCARVLLAYLVIKNRAIDRQMNIDYIRAKCKLLHGATPQERDRIFSHIGICAGLMSAQRDHLSDQLRDEIENWL